MLFVNMVKFHHFDIKNVVNMKKMFEGCSFEFHKKLLRYYGKTKFCDNLGFCFY